MTSEQKRLMESFKDPRLNHIQLMEGKLANMEVLLGNLDEARETVKEYIKGLKAKIQKAKRVTKDSKLITDFSSKNT